MSMGGMFNNYSSYINSQMGSLKKKFPDEKRSVNPFVTISRQTGAYGLTIARDLCEYLQKNEKRPDCFWAGFDKELIAKVVEEHHLPEKVLPYLSETTISEIQDIMEELFDVHPSQYTLVHKTGETILHLAQLGYAVIVGMASNIITAKLPGGVHIRLIGPLETRVKRVQEYYQMDGKKAMEFLLVEDQNRKNYVKKYFGKDVDDPSLYDMVINTGGLKPQEIVQVVGEFVLKRFSSN